MRRRRRFFHHDFDGNLNTRHQLKSFEDSKNQKQHDDDVARDRQTLADAAIAGLIRDKWAQLLYRFHRVNRNVRRPGNTHLAYL